LEDNQAKAEEPEGALFLYSNSSLEDNQVIGSPETYSAIPKFKFLIGR